MQHAEVIFLYGSEATSKNRPTTRNTEKQSSRHADDLMQ